MTPSSHKVTAGLVFLGNRTFDMAAMICRTAETLEHLGERVTERRLLSEEIAVVRAAGFDCRLQIAGPCDLTRFEKTAARCFLITLLREGRVQPGEHERLQAVIAHLLARLQATLLPDYVQWTDPDAVLTRAEFCAAVANTAAMPVPARTPRPKQRRSRHLPDVEAAYAELRAQMPGLERVDTEQERLEALRAAFRDPEPEARTEIAPDDLREPTEPLRLAVWMMTITLGLFALPVAAALAVINLLRGENLRLTSQAAALTGFFMVLSSTGQIAQAAGVLQSVIP